MNQQQQQKVVLVTGASTGIGRATVKHLVARNHQVFGTSRNPESAGEIDGVDILCLDVRDRESVRRCIDEVMDRSGRIDALVNNAGYALTGSAEETSDDDVCAQFETNYFGLVSITNAVLPLMREQRSGRIVNVSSLVGFAAVPFMAHYSASKFAVEGYSEALYHELLPFGIKVSLIQPGVTHTELFSSSGTQVPASIEAYEPWQRQAEASMASRIAKAISSEKVARAVVRAIELQNPALRYQVGPDASLVSRLKRFVPSSMFQRVWRQQMGLGKNP